MTPPDTTAIAVRDDQATAPIDREQAASALAHVLGTGDLYKLTNEQRVAHYLNRCRSEGTNPLSRPYQWIEFKETENAEPVLTLYFKPTAAAQVLRNNRISVHFPRKEIVGELFVCEAHGRAPDGREGVGTKYVPLVGKYGKLTGRWLANAFMTAETGALRRLALNMGLASGPDPDASGTMRTVYVDGTGAVLEQPTEEQRHLAEHHEVAKVIGEPTYETTAADWPEQEADLPDQRPTPEELTPPARPYQPPARFHCNAAQWQRTWFMLVKNTPLESDEARHDFVQWYTSSWPENRRTSSLSAYLSHATDRQAEALVNAAREWLAEQPASAPDDERVYDERVYDEPGSAPMRVVGERDAVEYPDRPLDGVTYDVVALRSFYRAWSDALRVRDTAHRAMTDVALSRATNDQLLREIEGLIGQVEAYDHFVAMEEFSDDGEAVAEADGEPF
ncbi:MAG TPA: hypothetical protein VN903_00855 [Polyangia bacterium]|nr:hypothetical protein [Polyangia bacterium]